MANSNWLVNHEPRVCPCCGNDKIAVVLAPDRVSVYGMYDCHLFHKFEAGSVDELINMAVEFNAEPHPAEFEDGRKVDDLGPVALCPAIVMHGDQEIRRVGQMVHGDYNGRGFARDALENYRKSLASDADIPRLLAAKQ